MLSLLEEDSRTVVCVVDGGGDFVGIGFPYRSTDAFSARSLEENVVSQGVSSSSLRIWLFPRVKASPLEPPPRCSKVSAFLVILSKVFLFS